MQRETVFEIEQVVFSYDQKHLALDDVTLEIYAGERLAILGSNGSGKSTLLKLMDGLYFPQQGEVRYRGNHLTQELLNQENFAFAFRRAVSLVFQDSDVQLFSPSVWDEVAFAPLQLDLAQAEVEARVEEALGGLNISTLRDRAPHRLSGGEKKKVAIASVLSLRPEIWLLDEPTAGLDPRSQSWLIDFIQARWRQGNTIVTATHDLDVLDDIADRVIVFNEAHKVEAMGTVAEILSDEHLLVRCNLAHRHRHYHFGGVVHEHHHLHQGEHQHTHAE
ncbi:MAG: ABC transporter ATP-binding protein [Chloroflexi bacterium]|nr:ABC transporter ATP-binding protein [Chloroflexota bacterium]